jgi:hypothetical protein
MARFGYDPYEEARTRAIFGETTGAKYLPRSSDLPFYDPKLPSDYADYDEDNPNVGSAQDSSPAILTERPTSSINSSRPRTVAAGYEPYLGSRKNPRDKQLGKLTVMFRDGTLYNYYDVTPDEWQKFRAQISKGPMLNWNPVPGFLLDGRDRGPADLTYVSEKARQSIYSTARSAQTRFQTRKGSVQKSARTKSQLSPKSATSKRLSQNPSNGGKNPFK